eukprot:gb/GECH01013809.1/.p1 GENE.gb/GECH01013809.1/~~gb/GECH01013809.1/.p1  ORF type:complete len:108 (+),score=15.41 gb/GECH01013809.1/:1-324(+)
MIQRTIHEYGRHEILGLYRQLLKSSDLMPTHNRRMFVVTKTKVEFRKNKNLKTKEDVEAHMRIGLSHLETVQEQAKHLKRFIRDDRLPAEHNVPKPKAPPAEEPDWH